MDFGLSVTLDPQGGNQVNFRRVIRAAEVKWGTTRDPSPGASGAEDEAEGSDASESDPPAAPAPKSSKAADEYDYDDDFIDDDELYVEETRGSIANDSSTAAPIVGEDEDLEFDPHAPIERDKPLPVVKLVDKAFYVNRGPIRPRITVEPLVRKARLRTRIHADSVPAAPSKPDKNSKETAAKQKAASAPGKTDKGTSGKTSKAKNGKDSANKNGKKPTKNGASESKRKSDGGKAKVTKSSTPKSGNSTTAKRPLKQQALTTSGKLSKASTPPPAVSAAVAAAAVAAGESAPKKRRLEGPSTSKKATPAPKPLDPQVVAEVGKLRDLCLEMFGDKKPRLNDPFVQAQLTTLFDVAINHNFGRLHSDISKENRKLTLNDELWSALKFLRTTRQYLEQLGHAIQWGAAEKRAVHQVEEATSAVSAAAATAGDAAFMKGAVGASMEEALQQYLRARIKRQDARNQLAAKGRTVTVRKAMTGWAGALKKGALAMCDVNEAGVLQALKKVDDRMNAAAKKKREEEKEARRKKKELPKNMADALPPALRNLASLKAKVGATSSSAKPSSAGSSKAGTSASGKIGDGTTKNSSAAKNGKCETKGGTKNGSAASAVKEVGEKKRRKKTVGVADVIELD